jgi:hypothetical protein
MLLDALQAAERHERRTLLTCNTWDGGRLEIIAGFGEKRLAYSARRDPTASGLAPSKGAPTDGNRRVHPVDRGLRSYSHWHPGLQRTIHRAEPVAERSRPPEAPN